MAKARVGKIKARFTEVSILSLDRPSRITLPESPCLSNKAAIENKTHPGFEVSGSFW